MENENFTHRAHPQPKQKANSNRQFRVELFSGIDFTGKSIRFTGPLAIRNLAKINFNDLLSSFRFKVSDRKNTLVLFEHKNFQGDFILIHGNASRNDLRRQGFNDLTSSIIAINRELTEEEIQNIQIRGLGSGLRITEMF
jgi:hypothetical protein